MIKKIGIFVANANLQKYRNIERKVNLSYKIRGCLSMNFLNN